MANRKDVARLANVSPPVVSYVLNNSNYVSPKTRNKVLAAIDELGYQPNYIAKSLKTKKTNHLFVLIHDFNNSYFSGTANVMGEYASRNGYIVSVFCIRYDISYIHKIQQYQIDGIFVTSDIPESLINEIAEKDIAVVFKPNREYKNLNQKITLFNYDVYKSVKKAIFYLLDKGHTNIVYISAPKPNGMDIYNYRYHGFFNALKERNIGEQNIRLYSEKTEIERIRHCISDIKYNNSGVTAIFGENDEVALKVVSELQKEGFKVPDDVAVVGCDNIRYAKYWNPPLTTIDVNIDDGGLLAAETLIKKVQDYDVKDIYLETSFIKRGTA